MSLTHHCFAVWEEASESLCERSHYSSRGVFKSCLTIASYRRSVTLSLTGYWDHSIMQHKQSFWHFWKTVAKVPGRTGIKCNYPAAAARSSSL